MDVHSQDQGDAEGAGQGPRLLRGLPASLLVYLEARGVLLTIEAREAFDHLVRSAAWGAVAAMLAFSGWLPLMAALIWLGTGWTGWQWWEVSLVAGGAHLVLAACVFLIVMRRLRGVRLFEHTVHQFRKDREWLGKLRDKG
jgi:uncharacterized membrane protein YqjE